MRWSKTLILNGANRVAYPMVASKLDLDMRFPIMN